MTTSIGARPDLAQRVALRVIKPALPPGSRALTNAMIALPDGTLIAGVQSISIEQGGLGQSPILTIKVHDFDVDIESDTNRRNNDTDARRRREIEAMMQRKE